MLLKLSFRHKIDKMHIETGMEVNPYSNPFDDARKRRAFISRVYALLFVMLTLTGIQVSVVLLV